MRIGGVPEAFNLPLYNLSEQPSEEGTTNAEQHTFVEVEGGTGALTSGLLEGEYDVIVALTEGLVCKIANGDDIVLLGTMVESPLCWAVSTSSASPYQSFEDLKGTTIGVSRYGSGSHLMASCEGRKKGWATNDLAYVVENNFASLRDSVVQGRSSAFLWEKYTTKPYHDRGIVRKIDEVVTPWPAFMLAAKRTAVEANPRAFEKVMKKIRAECFSLLHQEENQVATAVVERFGMKFEDALKWWKGVRITCSRKVDENALRRALSELVSIGQVGTEQAYAAAVDNYRLLVYAPLVEVESWPKVGDLRGCALMEYLDRGIEEQAEAPLEGATSVGQSKYEASEVGFPSEGSNIAADLKSDDEKKIKMKQGETNYFDLQRLLLPIEYSPKKRRTHTGASCRTRNGRGGWLPAIVSDASLLSSGWQEQMVGHQHCISSLSSSWSNDDVLGHHGVPKHTKAVEDTRWQHCLGTRSQTLMFNPHSSHSVAAN